MMSIRSFVRASLALVMATVVIWTMVACKQGKPAHGPQSIPVRLASVIRIDAPTTLIASGVVEPMQTVAVTAQVSATLMEVLFREGDHVHEGQVLFRLDPRQLQAEADQARANLIRDEAQAAAARKDDERYRRLVGMGYVSQSQADQFRATALAQNATVEADRAALRAAQVNLGFTTIRAPISGRTGTLLIRRGNNVSPTSGPIVVINQVNPVLVRFPILSQDLNAVRRSVAVGPLDVLAIPGDSGGVSEHGSMKFLNNEIDSLTGTVMGRATFANAERRMWPGELLYLRVQLGVQRDVVAIPTAAVLTNQRGTYVFVIDSTSAARSRDVTVGQQVGELTVIANGLSEGEHVVVDGISRLTAGTKVSVLSTGDTALSAPVQTRGTASTSHPASR